jgi:hypothetical protein
MRLCGDQVGRCKGAICGVLRYVRGPLLCDFNLLNLQQVAVTARRDGVTLLVRDDVNLAGARMAEVCQSVKL